MINNNDVLRRIRFIFNFSDSKMIELVNMHVSKHELSAFFHDPKQNQYRPCKDQILRNFLQGIQIKYHVP